MVSDDLYHFFVKMTDNYLLICNLAQGKYVSLCIGGRLLHEHNYLNGKENGECHTWFENGQMWQECIYKNGKLHGLCRSWYNNGQLQGEWNYVNGEKHGLCCSWYPDGRLWYKYNYVNGEIINKL